MRLALLLLLLAPALCLAEPATVIRATELKQQPATDAATRRPRSPRTRRWTRCERKGGWTRVKAAGGAEGWVRMLALRYAGAGRARSRATAASRRRSTSRAPARAVRR